MQIRALDIKKLTNGVSRGNLTTEFSAWNCKSIKGMNDGIILLESQNQKEQPLPSAINSNAGCLGFLGNMLSPVINICCNQTERISESALPNKNCADNFLDNLQSLNVKNLRGIKQIGNKKIELKFKNTD